MHTISLILQFVTVMLQFVKVAKLQRCICIQLFTPPMAESQLRLISSSSSALVVVVIGDVGAFESVIVVAKFLNFPRTWSYFRFCVTHHNEQFSNFYMLQKSITIILTAIFALFSALDNATFASALSVTNERRSGCSNWYK